MIQKFTDSIKAIKKSEKGFTLIELMIVVAIIGILAAIAIPQFAKYREKAYDAGAKADLSHLATSLESYFLDNGTYTTDQGLLSGFKSSTNVTLSISSLTSTGFVATAKHSASSSTFTYNSASGGFQ